MTMMNKAAVAVGAMALWATTARAAGPNDLPKYFVDGTAGSAVGHTGDGVIAAGATARLVPHLQVRGEFGRLTNVMPSATSDALSSLAASLGGPSDVTFDAKTPATYGTATARVTGRTFGRITPFASGGGGVAHMTTDISAVSASGDLTATFDAAAGPIAPINKPLLVAGGGVSVATGRRSSVDVEYRYDRIFTDTAIGTNRVVASMRFGF